MKYNSIKLTTAQFAKLHNVNKRTLHYYDEIGLFSPLAKGENGYRYYDLSQSLDFEYIRMLKELHMSIGEIQQYINHPTPKKFLSIVDAKEFEIDREIKKLIYVKKAIQMKKKQIEITTNLQEKTIEIVDCEEEKLSFLPYDFCDDDIFSAFSYIKNAWGVEQIRMGVGAMISVEKILDNDFSKYDGIYTGALHSVPTKHIFYRPKGKYISCYHKGEWNTLPNAYQKMISYANKKRLKLTGYAYEMGMNEFAIAKEEEYITRIMMKVEERS
ncbi:MerR family transcriptional regulator [Faecalimonas sp.]